MFARPITVEVANGSEEPFETEVEILQDPEGSESVVVWDAALVLSYFLVTHQKELGLARGKRVVELGSGTGAVGVVAAALGSSVLLTDLPEYAPLLKKNIEHNKNQITGQLEFLELAWGNSTHIEAAKKTRPDILLVSDCIYYKASIGPLLDTLVALSSSSSSSEPTVVYLCYEERTSDEKKSVLKRFFDLVEEQDFFSVHTYSTSQCHPDYASDDIKIIRLQQKK